ncbi:hypothetical protein [Litoreibacter arenae]|uniref:Lipoprotein n=1 Tax=Litoreibacter arenae DSM 19593 TaxID=1123360 RepID=S9QNL6_9RHOB|nr:hypothetical protein [Litoreibacter arenae]EPX81198.1 hypothetical protein thalar_00647 [Litoreibacter arenae DSM 19593]
MKLVLILVGVGLLAMGCAPAEMAIPLAGADGWLQVLANSESHGVPLLAVNW